LPQARMPQRTGDFGVMPQKLKTNTVEATLLSLYFQSRALGQREAQQSQSRIKSMIKIKT
jgi:hypothetical protein